MRKILVLSSTITDNKSVLLSKGENRIVNSRKVEARGGTVEVEMVTMRSVRPVDYRESCKGTRTVGV